MKINIKKFKDVITKATMNFGIETLQLRFNDRIKSDMISVNGTSISILNLENDVIDSNDEIVFNFNDVSSNVMPFLSIFDNEEVDLEFEDVFIKLKDGPQIHRIMLCSERAIKRLGREGVKDVEWFFETRIDEDLFSKFQKIKKIGARFGKVYFVVANNKLYIETSDRMNRYSNGVKFELADININDLSLNYTYNNMVNFFNCIDIEKGFTLKISYDNEQELGCIYAFSENENEKYALISRENV